MPLDPEVLAKVQKKCLAERIHWALSVVDLYSGRMVSDIDYSLGDEAFESLLVDSVRMIARHANYALDELDKYRGLPHFVPENWFEESKS